MNGNLGRQYSEVKAEFEANQKTLAELEAKQADLKNTLMRLNIQAQVQDRGITRSVPAWFTVGGAG